MKLYVLGVGDTFSEKHVTHALLLEHDGFRLAIDCPDSYRRVLRQARDRIDRDDDKKTLDLFAIDDVLITHVHGDHMNGLEGVGYFKHFAQKRPLNLHTIAPVKEGLWERRLALPMGQLLNGSELRRLAFEDYFAWKDVSLERATTIGPFTVRARITKHHVPTSALFVECGGGSVGISSDTAFDPELIAWLARADLVVHETNYGPAHTAYADLLGLDAAVKERMRLIHYPDELDPATTEIRCLREGEVITVA
ncbi:MAG: MBL fold metallo-hydrolase [Labilithrix sp.]|nr:MBL fold metallo-hydrolase [Labilithrix sp.]MCW5811156.1 MBL fold metallo-hydrolase [Labilithrix sp.]